MEIKIHCKYDELVNPNSLKNHPKNRNKHGQDQIERLAELYKYHGIRHPIIVSNLSKCIVTGHGRKLAALRAGLKEFPVVYQDFESSEAEYAFIQSDNAIALWAELDLAGINQDLPDLGPDFDIDMLGIKDFKLDLNENNEGHTDPDEVPEDVPTKAKLGDLFILGNHRLLCGDSTDEATVERLMNGEKADMVFTSPPYSDQRTYNGNKDLSVKNLIQFISAFRSYCDLYAINLGLKRNNGELITYWDEYIQHAKECDLKLLSWNVWDRSGEGGSIAAMTAEFPINHEFIFIFGNEIETNRFIPNKSVGRSTKTTIRQRDGSLKASFWKAHDFGKLGTVIKTELDKGKSAVKHPAKFPVSLPENYILACTDVGECIAEPFGGSGSTLIACEKTNRKCFMMELDPHYIDVIIQRWQNFTQKKAVREDGVLWDDIQEQTKDV